MSLRAFGTVFSAPILLIRRDLFVLNVIPNVVNVFGKIFDFRL